MALAIDATTSAQLEASIAQIETGIDQIHGKLAICDSDDLLKLKRDLRDLNSDLEFEHARLRAVEDQAEATRVAQIAAAEKKRALQEQKMANMRRGKRTNAIRKVDEGLTMAAQGFDLMAEYEMADEQTIGYLYRAIAANFPSLRLHTNEARATLDDYSFAKKMGVPSAKVKAK